MSAVYFVRQLGKVRGPFAPDHVGRLVAAGLIDPAAEVSTDRAGWCPLAAHPGFGGPEPVPIPPLRPTHLQTRMGLAPTPDNFEIDLSPLLPSAIPMDAGTGSEWFDNVELEGMGED